MISLFTKDINRGLFWSIIILVLYGFLLGTSMSVASCLLLLVLEGLVLNYLCFRYKIIGDKTAAPLVIFVLLSALILPSLSYTILVYGALWLVSFFLAYESRENTRKSTYYMIYLGIILGVAQAISQTSMLLFLPIFVLFYQTANRPLSDFVICILYFVMVLGIYAGMMFVMEIPMDKSDFLPVLSLDYSPFDTIVFKTLGLAIVAGLVIHFSMLSSYSFNHPNKSRIFNYNMLTQIVIALVIVLFTAEEGIILFALMPASILFSFGFMYSRNSVIANAAFAVYLVLVFTSLYGYHILML